MNPPYVLIDDGDVTLFQSITALEKYIESPDIDRYIVFDSIGRRLYFESLNDKKKNRKFGIVSVIPVRISRDNAKVVFEKEFLLMNLRNFLTRVMGVEPDVVDLSEILKKVQDLIGVLA